MSSIILLSGAGGGGGKGNNECSKFQNSVMRLDVKNHAPFISRSLSLRHNLFLFHDRKALNVCFSCCYNQLACLFLCLCCSIYTACLFQ